MQEQTAVQSVGAMGAMPAQAGGDALADALWELYPCPAWLHDAETFAILERNAAARERLSQRDGDLPEALVRLLAGGRGNASDLLPCRWPLRNRDGALVDAELSARSVLLHGRPAWLVIANDMVHRAEATKAVAAAEARYRSIFHNAVEGIFQTTPDGRYLDANPALARIYGYVSRDELMASITDISRQLYVDPSRRDAFVRLMREREVVEGFESQILRKDGALVWISESVRTVRSPEGALLYYEGTVVDITQRKVAEDQLRHDASHDRLTGLPNRAHFMRRTAEVLHDAGAQAPCALLFIDFDRFKLINDTLGHLAGDQFLVCAAQRLASAVRPGDLVARLGGDEFAILLPRVKGEVTASQVAERIRHVFQEPFEQGGRQFFISASIGIALNEGTYTRAEDLLRDADMAMYRAKERGRARQERFDAGMREQRLTQIQLETDLRTAVERGQLVLHYQPVVHLESGRTTSFEALVRWQHPTRGLLYPAEFIQLAEETGIILELGAWIAEAACQQLAEWRDVAGSAPVLSINVSGRQFLQPEFAARIGRALDEAGLSGDRLKIEVTESVLMDPSEGVTKTLGALRERGVGICLDDFGTGFSSLGYLQRFTIDQLKIDRSFVARLGTGDASNAILKAILDLARTLNLETVAEGVETPTQAEELRALGCAHAQGFHFSPPLAPELATALVATLAPVAA